MQVPIRSVFIDYIGMFYFCKVMTYVAPKKSVDYLKTKALLESAVQLCTRHKVSKKNNAEYYKMRYIQNIPSAVTKKSFHHSL